MFLALISATHSLTLVTISLTLPPAVIHDYAAYRFRVALFQHRAITHFFADEHFRNIANVDRSASALPRTIDSKDPQEEMPDLVRAASLSRIRAVKLACFRIPETESRGSWKVADVSYCDYTLPSNPI
jgi:hypothetical protein